MLGQMLDERQLDKGKIVRLEEQNALLLQRLFSREIARDPYYHEFHFWLALAYLRLGDNAEARVELALASETSTRGETRAL